MIGSWGSGYKEFEEAIELLPKLDVSELLNCKIPFENFGEACVNFRQRDYLKILLKVGN